MTWGQFKKESEAQGVTDDMPIWYIDISFPEVGNLHVVLDKKHQDKADNGLGLIIAA